MSEKICCIFVNKNSGKGCNIMKVDENGLCCRHRKKAKVINKNPEKTEKTEKSENKDKKIKTNNEDIYEELYENENEIEVLNNENDDDNDEIVKKREASNSEIQLIKYGYLAIIGMTEMLAPSHLKGAKETIEKDKYIDEILVEVANDYSDMLGVSNMDPGVKLLVITAMTLGTVAAINSKTNKNNSRLVSENNDNNNTKKLEEEIEKNFEDI